MLHRACTALLLLAVFVGLAAFVVDEVAASSPEIGEAADPAVPVPEPTARAMEYYRSGNLLWSFQQLWGLLVPFCILWFGLSAKLRDWVARVAKGRWLSTIVGFWLLYLLCTWAVDLPLSYYADYARPHAYGLSDQALSKWVADSLTGLVLAAVFGSLVIWIPFGIIKKSPGRWWIYTSLVAVPLAFAVVFIVPIWVEPLFNDFGPMADQALEAKILAMADRAGIEGSRVFEVDKSVDTNMVNAYVTGFGGTKRIVLWDTLLAQLDERQVVVVMGHEMGHYVLGHMRMFMGFIVVGIPTGLAVVHYTTKAFIGRYAPRIGFDALSDIAALPLIGVVLGVVGFVVAPGMNAVTRYTEHESDRFALEMTQDNYACATAFVKLQEQNLGNPRPGLLYKLWRSSHPPLGERIEFCNAYRPWKSGEAQEYVDLFRE